MGGWGGGSAGGARVPRSELSIGRRRRLIDAVADAVDRLIGADAGCAPICRLDASRRWTPPLPTPTLHTRLPHPTHPPTPPIRPSFVYIALFTRRDGWHQRFYSAVGRVDPQGSTCRKKLYPKPRVMANRSLTPTQD